jgi:hypothetical protein
MADRLKLIVVERVGSTMLVSLVMMLSEGDRLELQSKSDETR